MGTVEKEPTLRGRESGEARDDGAKRANPTAAAGPESGAAAEPAPAESETAEPATAESAAAASSDGEVERSESPEAESKEEERSGNIFRRARKGSGKVKALEAKIEKLEEELAAARKAEAENRDRWMRSAAEFENFRRRNQREKADLIRTAGEAVLTKLLDVADALRAATDASMGQVGEEALGQLRTGISHIQSKLQGVLESEGVTLIPADPGVPFDPKVHEALAQVPSADLPADSVHSLIQAGYVLGGKVLRPARVAVAVPPPDAAPVEADSGTAGDDEGERAVDVDAAGVSGNDANGAA